jgi:cell division protein FtsX
LIRGITKWSGIAFLALFVFAFLLVTAFLVYFAIYAE